MYSSFIHIAGLINEKLLVYPLLYGSLDLELRLSVCLNADDIDVLLPERFLKSDWDKLISLMNEDGYHLVDEHEHEFSNGEVTIAYAALESLTSFAGTDLSAIPVIDENGVRYLLLELADYLKVYEASSKDGYRKNIKNKQDHAKIALIKKALGSS